jgi:hypothetical protein
MSCRIRVLAASLLAALPAGAASFDPPDEAVLAVLPFLESEEPNRILVDLAPAGAARRMPFLLDTGATFSTITPRHAKELGVPIRRAKHDPYRRKTLLGRDLQFYIDTASSDTASKTGFEYGLLGGNFLSEYVVELDFPGRRVRLLDPEHYEVPETVDAEVAAVVPIEIVSNRPTLSMELNGDRSGFLFDTGAPIGTAVSGEVAERAGVESEPVEGYRAGGVWGEVTAHPGRAETVRIGPYAFGPAPVEVHPNGFFNFGVSDSGLVGYDVMAQFVVRIDYRRQRMLLIPVAERQVTWLGRTWTGWPEYLERREPPAEVSVAVGLEPAREARVPAPEDLEPAREVEPRTPDRVWLEIGAPSEGERRSGRLDWLEVTGWAGVGVSVEHDIAVVVDVSGSTMVASGIDVDGDGRVGKQRKRIDPHKSFNPAHYSSDTDDTVLAAELLATRKLVQVLDPDRSRIGLVSFSSGAEVHAPIGTAGEAMEAALDELAENFGSGMTNMALAIELALEALERAGGEARRKTVLILSDGYPTAPGSGQVPNEAALLQAERAYSKDVIIHTFGLGLDGVEAGDVFAAIAKATGGRYLRLASPGEVVNELPHIDLAGVASIRLENVTTGAAGQAVRVFPDGSFDGYVQLAAGDNRLRVTAVSEAGSERSLERLVRFDPSAPRDAAEAERLEAEVAEFKLELEARALELQLLAEMRRARAAQRGELSVRAEEPGEEQ